MLSVFSDALMPEEKSVIAEFTIVKLAKELDVSYVDKFAVEFFRCGPTPHFKEICVFGYALKLLVPPDPTFGAIILCFVLFLVFKLRNAFELKSVGNDNFINS